MHTTPKAELFIDTAPNQPVNTRPYVYLRYRSVIRHCLEADPLDCARFSPPAFYGAKSRYQALAAQWDNGDNTKNDLLCLSLLAIFLEDCVDSKFPKSNPNVWHHIQWVTTIGVKFDLHFRARALLQNAGSVLRKDLSATTQLWKDVSVQYAALCCQFTTANDTENASILAAIHPPLNPPKTANCELSPTEYIKWLCLEWDAGRCIGINGKNIEAHSDTRRLMGVTAKLLDAVREINFYKVAADVAPTCRYLRVQSPDNRTYLVFMTDYYQPLEEQTFTTCQWEQCVGHVLRVLKVLRDKVRLIHRDLHAGNFLLRRNTNGDVIVVKLIDGGEAALDTLECTTRVGGGAGFGGLEMSAIRAPEIWADPLQTCTATDWYAAAATMTMAHPKWDSNIAQARRADQQVGWHLFFVALTLSAQPALQQFWEKAKSNAADANAYEKAVAMLSLLHNNPQKRNLKGAITAFSRPKK